MDWKHFPRVPFQPHWLLRGGHVQTCFAAFWQGHSHPHRADQHRIATTGGDTLILHDDQPPHWRPSDKTVLLLHGLGGCHRSPYMVRIAHHLQSRGIRVFRLDQRGCGHGRGLARNPCHAGRSEDVEAAWQFVERTCPDAERMAVGFSLGGNLLVKWLVEQAAEADGRIARAMAVSAPLDLARCARNIRAPRNRIYDRWFVRSMLRQLQERRDEWPALADLELSTPPRSLYEFDDRVTAPLSGFATADEYYSRCSTASELGRIAVPTILLSAEDDPLIPAAMYREVTSTDKVGIRMVPGGGHVGFFAAASSDPDWHWLDWRVVEFAELSSANQGSACLADREVPFAVDSA